MRITLHRDPHIHAGAGMDAHVHSVLSDALTRFGNRVTSVDAHLAAANSSAKAGADSTYCTLQASLVHQEPVVVKEKAVNAHVAIAGAVRKLKRAVGVAIGKQDPRRSLARALRPNALGDQTGSSETVDKPGDQPA
jgi:ribosome-associated translation inhibitor RaiA